MADNTGYNPGSSIKIASREITYSGDIAQLQVAALATVAGPDDAKTATDVSEENPLPVADINSRNLLLRILQMLMAPLGYDKSLGRQRGTVIMESGTLTTVGTVSSVANIAGIGGYPAQMQIIDANRAAWALAHRSRIT